MAVSPMATLDCRTFDAICYFLKCVDNAGSGFCGLPQAANCPSCLGIVLNKDEHVEMNGFGVDDDHFNGFNGFNGFNLWLILSCVVVILIVILLVIQIVIKKCQLNKWRYNKIENGLQDSLDDHDHDYDYGYDIEKNANDR